MSANLCSSVRDGPKMNNYSKMSGDKKRCTVKQFRTQKTKLPSLSYATSLGRGPQRPNFTGVGDRPRVISGWRSYSLDRLSHGSTEAARMSRGGTLNARDGDGKRNGGTLLARSRLGVKPRLGVKLRRGAVWKIQRIDGDVQNRFSWRICWIQGIELSGNHQADSGVICSKEDIRKWNWWAYHDCLILWKNTIPTSGFYATWMNWSSWTDKAHVSNGISKLGPSRKFVFQKYKIIKGSKSNTISIAKKQKNAFVCIQNNIVLFHFKNFHHFFVK